MKLSAALRRSTAALSAAVRPALRGDSPGIHRLRVATRRLREALAILGDRLPARREAADELARRLRRVTQGLGPVRELDVARELLAEYADRYAWPTAAVSIVDASCVLQRERAMEATERPLDDVRRNPLTRRLRDLASEVDAVSSSRPSGRLREAARTLAREIGRAGTAYEPAALHEIRIAAKKLRYVLELQDQDTSGVRARLRALQTALGGMHDAQVLQRQVDDVAASVTDRGVMAELALISRAIETDCRERHARVLKLLPAVRTLARRLAAHETRPRTLTRPARMSATAARRTARPRRRSVA